MHTGGPTEFAGWVAPQPFEVLTVVLLRIRFFWDVTIFWASADVSKRRSAFIFIGQVFQVEYTQFFQNVGKHPTTHHHIPKDMNPVWALACSEDRTSVLRSSSPYRSD